jgi:hypothetical protein
MMLKVEKSELCRTVSVLGKVVSQRSQAAVYRSVRIKGADGRLRFSAMDGAEQVTMALPATGDGAFDTVVDFSDLRDVLKGGRTGELVLQATGNGLAVTEVIRGHEISRVLNDYGTAIWPEEEPIPDEAAGIELPDNITALLLEAAPIVNRQDVRPVLRGINLSSRGLTVTDGKQLLHLPSPLEMADEITLPFPLALLAAKPEGAGVLYSWSSETIRRFQVEIGDFRWTGRALPGAYPVWQHVIPADTALDYAIRLEKDQAVQLTEFLKRVPDHPPHHAIELNVVTDGVEVIPVNYPEMSIKLAAEHEGARPRAVLAINKLVLLRMLQQGYTTFRAHSDGTMPIIGEGGYGCFLTMPIRAIRQMQSPEPPKAVTPVNQEESNPQTQVQEKEKEVMNEEKTKVAPVERTGVFEEINANLEDLRGKLKSLFDESAVITRKIKEAALQQKQKEREFIQAKRAIERIKVASGF